jgi:6-pyruvoyltetrahydropterin/6-carboxytetrahydropterin synthase
MIRVSRRYHFCASHRLHTAVLDEEANRILYGKCNNPYGHGHNYELDVSALGPIAPRTGRAVDLSVLDALVRRYVVDAFDHRDLNTEFEAFQHAVPTSENLGREICRRLKQHWGEAFTGEWPRLEKVCIAETARNIFQVSADEID